MHKQNILQVRAFLVSSCQRTLLVNVSSVIKDCVMEKGKKYVTRFNPDVHQ